jgi:tRNA-specific 2-thiouridylase
MRIAVGMSGGVDSTMTAALLRDQGHEVVGLTMSLWDGAYPVPDQGRGCYGPGEPRVLARARLAAEQLGIPHHVVPVADAFRQSVLEEVRAAYRAGRTPNPCMLCNRFVKFEALWNQAGRLGVAFDRFATGHYARLDQDPDTGRPRLRRAADAGKDQSYFLCRLTPDQLGRSLFPLGDRRKEEMRTLARQFGFEELAGRPESQDFLQSGDYSVLFAGETLPRGPIVHVDGRVLGEHRGLAFYTVGQRKGLGVSGTAEPLYVVRLDPARQAIIVGPREALETADLTACAVNWLAWETPPEAPFRAQVRIRQQHQPAWATVKARRLDREFLADVVFDEPQWAVTPGQTAAFYRDHVVLGGGIIAQPG